MLTRIIKKIGKEHEDDSCYHKAVEKQIGPFRYIMADWKEINGEIWDQFISAMQTAGLEVVEDPRMEGTDCYGVFIFHPNFGGTLNAK